MKIYHNNHQALHDLVGRFIKLPGQAHLHYYDAAVHRPEPHPADDVESPLRPAVILDALRSTRIGIPQPPCDSGLDPIRAVHTADYLNFLEHIYAENAAHVGYGCPVWPEAFPVRFGRQPTGLLGRKGYYAIDVYTPIVEGTWQAAYWSVQTALSAAQAVMNGERVSYALCRPSGHHAARDLYGGYCFLNNAAAAARFIQQRKGARVALVDIDYHHGNGSQDIFYRDPNVLFVSIHGDPQQAYPYYTGWADERGDGPGEGFNLNIPLPNGTADAAYLDALRHALEAVRAYDPAYLVISAGFDIGAGDPYGGFKVTVDGIREVGTRLRELGLPTVLVQEGGYVPARLGEYVVAFLKAFEV